MMQMHEPPINAKATRRLMSPLSQPSRPSHRSLIATALIVVVLGCCAVARLMLHDQCFAGRDADSTGASAKSNRQIAPRVPNDHALHATDVTASSQTRAVAAGSAFAAFSQWSAIDMQADRVAVDELTAQDFVSARVAFIESDASRSATQTALDELAVRAAMGDQLALSAYLRHGEGSDSHTERALQLLHINAAHGSVFALMTLAYWSRAGVGLSAPDTLSAAAFDYIVWLMSMYTRDAFPLVPGHEQTTEEFEQSLALVGAWCANRTHANVGSGHPLRADALAYKACL